MNEAWAIHVGKLLRRGAERNPGKVAVIWEEGTRTYGELLRRVDRLSAGLAARGVQPGDRVGVLFQNGPHFLEAWWAVAQMGAVVVPLSTRALAQDFVYVLSDAQATAMLADAEFLPTLMDVRHEVGSLRLVVGQGAPLLPEVVPFEALATGSAAGAPAIELTLNDPCAIYYTAGTTGVSKGAVRSHLSVTWGLALLAARIPPNEVYLARAPMYHTGGSLTGPFATLAAGATLVSMRGFDARALLAAVERYRLTRIYVHPTLVANALLDEMAHHRYDLSSLRYIQWTAGPLPEAVRARLLEAFPGLPFEVTYGMTEVSNIASYEYTGGPLKAASCVGLSPVGTAVRIVDENDQSLPAERVGEVAVRSPTAMTEYWRDPERTAAVLAGGWVHSGDLGYLDTDGYLHLAGRQKDSIKTGGETVHAVEVENALASLPAVVEAAVVGLPDATWGEAVTAVVVPRPGAELTPSTVIAHCRQHLPGYKCPKHVLFVDSLPKNSVGKVQKVELVRRHADPAVLSSLAGGVRAPVANDRLPAALDGDVAAPRDAHVMANGVDLHYLEWPGTGPPLVLLHATGLLAALWAPVAARLAAQFHVYALDFPGHGDSARPPRTWRWEAFAEDARAFVDALGLGQPRVMGHSMGATVAALLAARYPALVGRLVLVEPVVMVPEVIGREILLPGVPTAAGTRKRRAVWPDRASMLASYQGRGPFAYWEPALLARYAAEGAADRADGQVELKCPPELEAQMYCERSYLDVWSALRAIACPTLLVYGSEPRPYPRAPAQDVQAAIPGAEIAYVPGTGHFLPQERPAALADLAEPFLAGP